MGIDNNIDCSTYKLLGPVKRLLQECFTNMCYTPSADN